MFLFQVHYFTQVKSKITPCPNGIPQYEEYFYINCTPNIPHDPPLLFNLDRDPFEKYPLDTNLYPDVLRVAAQKVAEHKNSITRVSSQLEKVDSRLAPCCNPPSCTCGYSSSNGRDEL